MDNVMKICLIVGASLIILGLIIFAVVMTINHWDFSRLSTVKYVTNTYRINQEFTDISIQTDTADILFVPSDSEECEVICYEEANAQHRVTVEDGCLTVQIVENKKWYEHIGINFGSPKLTVSLPRSEYRNLIVKASTGDTEIPNNFAFESINIAASTGHVTCFASASEDLKIRVSTGNIRAENLSAGALDFSVSTGHVTASGIRCEGQFNIRVSTGKATLNDVTCGNLTSTGTTGKLIANHVTATETLSIKRSTGDVTIDKCDAAELFIKTSTGNVTGSLLTEKVFITQTSTGRVEVPKTITGGRCEITTDTGNIKIKIAS